MIPIKFPGHNLTLNPAKGTENFVQPLPVHTDGRSVSSCWQLSPEEIELLNNNGGVIWYTVDCGAHFYPVLPSVTRPRSVPENGLKECLLRYKTNDGKSLPVYNRDDNRPPEILTYREEHYYFDQSQSPAHLPGKALSIGDFYLRLPQPEEAKQRKEIVLSQLLTLEIPEADKANVRDNIDELSLTIPVLVEKLKAGMERIWY